MTKTVNTDLVGGIIDNSGLDEAIKDDVSANEYKLGVPDASLVDRFEKDMVSGTIILFEEINDGIRNKIEYIRKLVALYFRFSLLDPSFSIFMNGSQITLDELTDLIDGTQFLWKINKPIDPYISDKLRKSEVLKREKDLQAGIESISGFIASVEKPSMLKIRGSDEKVSIDLYVNGRLREKDVLKHFPTARIVESYLYGQIHYNALDDENDRFTSSREGVVSDDPKFIAFLKEIEKLLKFIIEDWDVWRTELNQDGDSENKRITRKERKSRELFSAVADDFVPPKTHAPSRKKSRSGSMTWDKTPSSIFLHTENVSLQKICFENILSTRRFKFRKNCRSKSKIGYKKPKCIKIKLISVSILEKMQRDCPTVQWMI